MTNKRAVHAFLATSALFLAMSGMNARAQDASAPAAQAPAAAQAPSTTARAAKPAHHGGFKAIDTNGDGQISRDEAKGHAWLEKNFDQIDTNHDGKVTEDEIRAYMQARHDARKAQKAASATTPTTTQTQ